MGKAVKRLEITYYDKDTGEILASVDPEELVKKLEWKAKKKRRAIVNEFCGGKVMIFQDILKKAVKELTEGELRVLNYMLGVMDFENWINIPQKEMAKEVGIHPKTISRIMKRLVEKGYIEIYKKGRENFYRIRPEVAWKGTEREHLKVLRNNNPILDTMLKK
jgi:DNA-binding transcriptional ArsR family regulator